MKEFFKKYKVAVIVTAVLLIVIIAGVVIRLAVFNGGGKDKEGYFAESEYPVTAQEKKDGSLIIKVDGSKTSNLKWKYKNSDKNIAKIKKQKEKNGVLTVSATPVEAGYCTVTFTMQGKIKDLKYNAVEVDVNLNVEDFGDDNKSVSIGEISQASASAGALDTDTPYLIDDNSIILPNGGDWYLVEVKAEDLMSEKEKTESNQQQDEMMKALKEAAESSEGAAAYLEYLEAVELMGSFNITGGVNDDGMECINVYPNNNDMSYEDDAARFVLVSEKLGIKQMLKYRINESSNPQLVMADEEVSDNIDVTQVTEAEQAQAKSDAQFALQKLQRLQSENGQESAGEASEQPADESAEETAEEPAEDTEEQ